MKFQTTSVQLFSSSRAIRFHAQEISCTKDLRNVGTRLSDVNTQNAKNPVGSSLIFLTF